MGRKLRLLVTNILWFLGVGQVVHYSSLKIIHPDLSYVDVIALFFIIVGVRGFITGIFNFYDWFNGSNTKKTDVL